MDWGRYKKVAENVTELIGLTPLIKLRRLTEHAGMSELALREGGVYEPLGEPERSNLAENNQRCNGKRRTPPRDDAG